ncbi:signal peptidase I [Clostridium gasigenes]|uniref:Signal peptidase I n=1 Tax=Clostridium gasigenes TaxID=94869 RepID=A0A1H0VCC5_9CLOT|nr:signal peptidase I [Clostridium gasigenes]
MIKNKNIMKEIRGGIFSVLVAICIVSVVNSKVLANVKVEQSSMDNTLHDGQHLIVNKLNYNFSDPKRGDIIIFLENCKRGTIIEDTMENIKSILGKKNNNNNRLVKRVIGVSGDEVDIRDGVVYLNNEKLDEPYAKGETISNDFKLPITVSEGKVFVLGDNRAVSRDSRKFGLIDCNQVEGSASFRVYPFDEIGSIK